MAINVTAVKATAKAALKTAMALELGEPESTYDTVAGLFTDSVVDAILTEIKVNADLTGVTAGGDTVVGGVD